MIKERVEKLLGIGYESRLLIIDKDMFYDNFDYHSFLQKKGYAVYFYAGIEEFRLVYEREIRYNHRLSAIIVRDDIYIPYDIQKAFYRAELSLEILFPKLHIPTLKKHKEDLELIDYAYDSLYSASDSPNQTEAFLRENTYVQDTVLLFAAEELAELQRECKFAVTYLDWIKIAKKAARLNYFGAVAGSLFDTDFIDDAFEKFILSEYGKLSGEINEHFPPILPKTLRFISKNGTEKAALVVMDGMSLFDFEVLSRHMLDFRFDYYASFAVIPTMTSISRQSLLTGKYPQELTNPFTLGGEERGFIDAGLELGYAKNQVQYLRGYESPISLFTRFAAIIINDIDDIVHGQQQGRIGMLGSVTLLAESGKLQKLIRSLYAQDFTVYITSDHGNTSSIGVGNFRAGVETETNSKRMVVLKNFAEETEFLRENTILLPGYYLDKNYRYYVCKRGKSFNNKHEEVMTHGGISIDEVIVPFIKIVGI